MLHENRHRASVQPMSVTALEVALRQKAYEAGYNAGCIISHRYAATPESLFASYAAQAEDYLDGWKAGYRDKMAGLI